MNIELLEKDFLPYIDELEKLFKSKTVRSYPIEICNTIKDYWEEKGYFWDSCEGCCFNSKRPGYCDLSELKIKRSLLVLDLMKRRIQNEGIK